MRRTVTLQDVRLAARRFVKYDFIVGIPRDGIIPAAVVALELDLPLYAAYVNRAKKQVIFAPKKPKGRGLIIDDVVRTGTSMGLVAQALPQCDTCCVFTDYPELVKYCMIDPQGEWMVPEWEAAIEAREFFEGFDLDGILCDEPMKWEKPLYRFVPYIHFRQAHKQIRLLPNPQAVIVTGRPEEDRDVTIAWLRKNGVTNHVVFNKGDPLRDAVKTKVQAIRSHQIKVFWESDEEQATEIRRQCPFTEVNVI